MGHAAASVQTVANAFAVMLAIYKTGNVSLESPLNSKIRAIVAVGMALGILLAGWRMVPVSGKSSPMHAVQQQANCMRVMTCQLVASACDCFGWSIGPRRSKHCQQYQ